MNSKSIPALMFTVLLIMSILFNIYQFVDNKQLSKKIERFLPLAAEADKEMEFLKYNNDQLIEKLSELENFRDSVYSGKINPETDQKKVRLFPDQPEIAPSGAQSPIPNQPADFKDLNKKEY